MSASFDNQEVPAFLGLQRAFKVSLDRKPEGGATGNQGLTQRASLSSAVSRASQVKRSESLSQDK